MSNDQPQSRSLTLKPCPFCGGTPVFRTGAAEGIPSGHFLECDGCHASTALVFPLKDDVTRELAERWNRRAPVSETGPSVEQYRQAVEKTVQLRLALQQCVAVAEMWHGDEAFDLYYNHSPEMKLIRDALGKMPAPTDAPSERKRG